MKKMQLNQYTTVLSHASPKDMLMQRRMHLGEYVDRLQYIMEQKLSSAKHQMALYAEELKGLSPLYKLQGGYSYVSDTDGKNVRFVKGLRRGQKLNVAMTDGQAVVCVEEIKEQDKHIGNEE